MFLLTAMSLLAIGLLYGPVVINPGLAVPPDICFEEHCAGKGCENNVENLTATCCWDEPDGNTYCQTCDVDTDSGEFENCTNPRPVSLGQLDDTVVAPQPSGKAPPQSTGTCPNDIVVDRNGNCTPVTQLPDEAGDTNKNSKPDIRGNILNDGPVAAKDPSALPIPPKGNIDGTRAPINEGVLDQSFSSKDNNDNTGESNNAVIGTQSENPSQESSPSSSSSSETSSSEQTTNFAKKGGTQNSPVPPECPKQGPIPPDCTMKPKF